MTPEIAARVEAVLDVQRFLKDWLKVHDLPRSDDDFALAFYGYRWWARSDLLARPLNRERFGDALSTVLRLRSRGR